MSAWGRLFVIMVAWLIALHAYAAGGDYSISPLRIELDRDARSAVVTLVNTGDETIDFQVSAMDWTQDADGRDVYQPAADLVFFPKIFTLRPGSETRVIRIGTQGIPPATERAYRLFVEPIPKRRQEPLAPGANVAVTLRFGLPVFVKPPLPHAAGEIDALALSGGRVSFVARNTGNEHLRFDEGAVLVGRDAAGAEVLSQKLELRYLLAGVAKPISFAIAKDVCARLVKLDVTARAASNVTLSRQLATTRASCE